MHLSAAALPVSPATQQRLPRWMELPELDGGIRRAAGELRASNGDQCRDCAAVATAHLCDLLASWQTPLGLGIGLAPVLRLALAVVVVVVVVVGGGGGVVGGVVVVVVVASCKARRGLI